MIYGNVISTYYENEQIFDQAEILNLYYNLETLDFIKRSNGNFYIKKSYDTFDEYYTSLQFEGLHFSNELNIFVDENSMYENDISITNSHYLTGHHSIRRFMFEEIFEGHIYIPAGFVFTHDKKSNILLNKKPLLLKFTDIDNDIQSKNLLDLFKLNSSLFENKSMAFSGGIDSFLLSLIYKVNLYYKNYNKLDELIPVKWFSKSIQTVNILDKYKKPDDLHLLHSVTLCEENKSFNDWGGNDAIISGQNSDTLLHGDHYAPNSRIFGFRRIIKLFLSAHKRFLLSDYFFYLLPKRLFVIYIKILICIPNEHATIFELFKYDRKRYKLLDDVDLTYENFNRTFFYKSLRFYKTVVNFNTQFSLRESCENKKYYLPYSLAPVNLKLLQENNRLQYILNPKSILVKNIDFLLENKCLNYTYWSFIKTSFSKYTDKNKTLREKFLNDK